MIELLEPNRSYGFERISLLSPGMEGRDIQDRFSFEEKVELAGLLRDVWNTSHGFNREQAEIAGLRNSKFVWGNYPDGEANALSTAAGRELAMRSRGKHLYALVNLENEGDLVAMRTIFKELGVDSVTVGSMYFPYQRGDRPEHSRSDPSLRELILLDTLVNDVVRDGVKRMVVVDSHSPAFSWFALKHSMAVLDLTAIPAMLAEAERKGFLEGGETIGVGGDAGAFEMGCYVRDCLGISDAIFGNKRKEDGRTIVTYTEEDLRKVRGRVVVLGEDIISTGGTMKASVDDFLQAGAMRVVILATYPIFAGEALERLGFDERVKVVTTDGRTPMTDISRSTNIIQVPIFDRLENILRFDKEGLDFWSAEGRQALDQIGFDLAPWQIYDLRGVGNS